jgi:CHAP domain
MLLRLNLPRLILLGLALTLSGCAAPQASANDAASRFDEVSPRDQATQQALRPSAPELSAVDPDSLTLLTPVVPRPRPAIVKVSRPLQCVPYARELSKIALRGNAWTWWTKAKGRYERGNTPQPGAVLVLSKTRRLRLGHLAVVAEVMNEREILVHQANWLNRGRVHRFTPVRDISKNNDWSVVRVWYTPGRVYGSGRYPAYGFIYPNSGDSTDMRQAAN